MSEFPALPKSFEIFKSYCVITFSTENIDFFPHLKAVLKHVNVELQNIFFIFKLFIEFLIQEYTYIYIYTILYRLSETHSVAKKKYCFFMGIALLSRVGHRIRHGRLPSFLVLHVPCGHHGRHGGHHPSACCLLSGVARHLSCPRFSVKRLSSSLFSMG